MPGTATSSDTVTISVGLDGPASATVGVDIAADGMYLGQITISAGQMSADASFIAGSIGLPVGSASVFSATLGPVTLQATLMIL